MLICCSFCMYCTGFIDVVRCVTFVLFFCNPFSSSLYTDFAWLHFSFDFVGDFVVVIVICYNNYLSSRSIFSITLLALPPSVYATTTISSLIFFVGLISFFRKRNYGFFSFQCFLWQYVNRSSCEELRYFFWTQRNRKLSSVCILFCIISPKKKSFFKLFIVWPDFHQISSVIFWILHPRRTGSNARKKKLTTMTAWTQSNSRSCCAHSPGK